MFERYTEHARRVLFFSRYESSQLGSLSIRPEHVMLGLIRERESLVADVFSNAGLQARDIVTHITCGVVFEQEVPASVEIPFAEGVKRALSNAAEEADQLSHQSIDASHLLLGLLRLDDEPLVAYLAENGLTLES